MIHLHELNPTLATWHHNRIEVCNNPHKFPVCLTELYWIPQSMEYHNLLSPILVYQPQALIQNFIQVCYHSKSTYHNFRDHVEIWPNPNTQINRDLLMPKIWPAHIFKGSNIPSWAHGKCDRKSDYTVLKHFLFTGILSISWYIALRWMLQDLTDVKTLLCSDIAYEPWHHKSLASRLFNSLFRLTTKNP